MGLSYAEAQRRARSGDAEALCPTRDLFLHLGLFDELDDASARALRDAQARLTDEVLAAAHVAPGQAVLEVGSGLGGTLAVLDERLVGARLVGLDVDPEQVAFTRSKVVASGRNTLAIVEGDACALPMEDGTFDRVLAIECAFHFSSRARFMAEAARVLRPGGRLVLTDLVASDALVRARAEGRAPTLVGALVAGLGPWPDLYGDEGGYADLAACAGLAATGRRDLTLATLPSYACILAGKTVEPGRDDVDAGVAALAWLQLTGLVRTELWVLER